MAVGCSSRGGGASTGVEDVSEGYIGYIGEGYTSEGYTGEGYTGEGCRKTGD